MKKRNRFLLLLFAYVLILLGTSCQSITRYELLHTDDDQQSNALVQEAWFCRVTKQNDRYVLQVVYLFDLKNDLKDESTPVKYYSEEDAGYLFEKMDVLKTNNLYSSTMLGVDHIPASITVIKDADLLLNQNNTSKKFNSLVDVYYRDSDGILLHYRSQFATIGVVVNIEEVMEDYLQVRGMIFLIEPRTENEKLIVINTRLQLNQWSTVVDMRYYMLQSKLPSCAPSEAWCFLRGE